MTGRGPRRRTTMGHTELVRKLDAAIAEKNLLTHPFYQDWQAGKLSREALQLYASQYYRHVEAFPGHPGAGSADGGVTAGIDSGEPGGGGKSRGTTSETVPEFCR